MKRMTMATLLVLGLSSLGCRAARLQSNNEALERENFHLERKIDDLTWQLEDAESELLMCEQSRSQPRRGTSPSARPGRARPSGAPPADDDIAPPSIDLPEEERGLTPDEPLSEQAPSLELPQIIPPDPQVPEGVLPRPAQSSSTAPSNAPQQPTLPQVAPEPEPELQPSAAAPQPEPVVPQELPGNEPRSQLVSAGPSEAAELAINPALTVWNRGTSPGEGLQVVVEPQTSGGKLVKAIGEVAIVVLDPALTGPASRVARWDFTAEEVASRYRGAQPGGGLHFDLEWPESPPQSQALELFVRLTMSDGRKLVAEHQLRPAAAIKQTGAWTGNAPSAAGTAGPALRPAEGTSANQGWRRARPLPPQPSEGPAVAKDTEARQDSAVSRANWEPYR